IRKLAGADGKLLSDEVRRELMRELGKNWLALARNQTNSKRKRELLNELVKEIPNKDILDELAKLGPEVPAERLIRAAVQELVAERFSKAKSALGNVRAQVQSDMELVNKIDPLLR